MAINIDRNKIEQLKLTYIIGTYPLLTTTFIDREIRLLQQWGVNLQIVSIRRPRRELAPEQLELQKRVQYLLPISVVTLVMSHLWFMVFRPWSFWRTLFYLFTRPHPDIQSRFKSLLHFSTGVYAAYVIREDPGNHVHAHFVDRATTVALVIGRLHHITYSATAHATDIYVNPIMLREKISQAGFIATCTQYNKDYLATTIGPDISDKVKRIYHGLDMSHYHPHHQPTDKPLLISVGQLKEKKGFGYLLKACRLLKERGYEFECQIVGEGHLREELEAQIRQLGLENDVTLCGALPHQAVIDKYKQATLFALPCVVQADGERDGIPNVILEALAMELPVVSTRHSGIPEVIEDGENGLLVPPEEVVPLANALMRLLDDPDLCMKLGSKGRGIIMASFSVESNVEKLLKEFTA
jgi:glycosyltransferase involved in cell wall biosynthesis